MSELFLVASLFFPRISLFFAYINGGIPLNPVPFWADFFLAVFVPRVLTLIYIYVTYGVCGWFWAHLVVAAIVYLGGSRYSSSSD